jgi:uncharacterized membrane protein YidH (DUF202 family)
MSKRIFISAASVLSSLAFPLLAGAVEVSNFDQLISALQGLINSFLPFLVGLAVLLFIFGVVQYVMAGGDADKRKTGQAYMIWGIVALFIMVSVWGLVNLLGGTFGLNKTAPPLPEVEISS